jgi:hypothetical protein
MEGDMLYNITPLTSSEGSLGNGLNNKGDVFGNADQSGQPTDTIWFSNNSTYVSRASVSSSRTAGRKRPSGRGWLAQQGETTPGFDAMVVKDGVITNLSTIVPGAEMSGGASAINNFGVVCTGSTNSNDVLLIDSTAQTLKQKLNFGLSVGQPFPMTINDAHEFAGTWVKGATEEHAFLYRGGNFYDLGENSSVYFSLNNSGRLAGSIILGNEVLKPVWWELGPPPSNPVPNMVAPPSGWDSGVLTGINDSGWMVGTAVVTAANGPQQPASTAFICTDGKTSTELNSLLVDSSWDVFEATGINKVGQIAGTGTQNGSNWNTAVLLTPLPVNKPPLPPRGSPPPLGRSVKSTLCWSSYMCRSA